jgi:NAD(P)-dependent dehydrogenase (short-subunit alcohol dehydrogenase family)
MFDLNGRVVVVTGGLGQLGREYVSALSAHGARVAVVDSRMPSGADVALASERVHFEQADVTNREALVGALAGIRKRWEVPFGLINNAALDAPPNAPIEETGPFENYPEDSWDAVLAVNLKGAMLCCQVFGGAMAAEGRGSIINVASIYGLVSPDQRIYEYRRRGGEQFYKPVAYCTSKAGILNLTRYLATYWAPNGVRVNTLTLGGVYNQQDEAFVREYSARCPMGRMAEAGEYSGAVVLLCSDASTYMTGANLVMDGGWTAW